MSVILGINTFHAGSSAAVIVDGVPVVAIAEERLNRKKYFAGFPKLAVQKCLDEANVKFSDIDAVAVGRDSSANLHKKLEFALRNPSQLLNLAKMRAKKKNLDDLKALIIAECECRSSYAEFQDVQYRTPHRPHGQCLFRLRMGQVCRNYGRWVG